jgi:adenosine/AMP kinase
MTYSIGSKQRCAAISAGDHYVMLYVAEGYAINETVQMHQANADFIVTACNSHDALVKALKRILPHPLYGCNDRSAERKYWEYEQSKGRGQAQDMIFAIDMLDAAEGKQASK